MRRPWRSQGATLPGKREDAEIMDISPIPKFFWYAVGSSLFVLAVGFVYVMYTANVVSVEIANTKINLSQAALNVQQASAKLENQFEQMRKTQRSSEFGPDIFQGDSTDCEALGLDSANKKLCEAMEGIQTNIDESNEKVAEALETLKTL